MRTSVGIAVEPAMVLNLPILLTLLRIVLLPVIVVVFYLDYSWARPLSCIIFVLAGITDWLDGYLARKLGPVSYTHLTLPTIYSV